MDENTIIEGRDGSKTPTSLNSKPAGLVLKNL